MGYRGWRAARPTRCWTHALTRFVHDSAEVERQFGGTLRVMRMREAANRWRVPALPGPAAATTRSAAGREPAAATAAAGLRG